MKTRTLKQLLLYNYRYIFAYIVIIAFVAYFLGWQLGQIGPGLSAPEITTAARHTTLSEIVKLPIYPLQAILQWGMINLFGTNTIFLRLPSVFIAFLVAFSLYKLLKKWFGRQTALLSTAVLISADWFLFTARLGTGSIEFSLWLMLGLLCFTKLLEHKTSWLLVFSFTLVALLFTPLGPYAAITLAASLIFSRIFRERANEAPISIKLASYAIGFLGLAGAAYISIINTEFLKNILNITNIPGTTEFIRNVFFNTSAVVAIFPDANPVISPTGVLFIRFFELIFILFGVVMLWKTRVNRLNLTVLVLSCVLVLASGLSSGSRGNGILIVPATIYMTAGVRHLMHRWKRTFPKNPYARVAAYVPLGALFICVVSLHYFSYFVLWPGQTSTHAVFSPDIQLAQKELKQEKYNGKTCLIDTTDQKLQKLYLKSKLNCSVVFPDTVAASTTATVQLMQPSTQLVPSQNNTIRALTSTTKENSLRWLVVTSNN